MGNIVNPSYLPAMQAFNDFFEMLFHAIRLVNPEIPLSTSSAFGWRSYQIDEYENLTVSRYFFQINYAQSKTLLFQEGYRDRNGQYFYPFKRSLNLDEIGFFNFNQHEQIMCLENFVQYALADGVLWQDSDFRNSCIPAEYRTRQQVSNPKIIAGNFGQISENFLLASPMQAKIFEMLGDALDRLTQAVFSRTNTREFNTQWRNWTFRGIKMKINDADNTEPSGHFEYVWRIYFHNPTAICFEWYDGKNTSQLHPPFEMDNEFLESSDDEQQNAIDNFVRNSLESLLIRNS